MFAMTMKVPMASTVKDSESRSTRSSTAERKDSTITPWPITESTLVCHFSYGSARIIASRTRLVMTSPTKHCRIEPRSMNASSPIRETFWSIWITSQSGWSGL